MSITRFSTNEAPAPDAQWETPVRALHWLTAACLLGATALTSQHEIAHAVLGLTALGVLLIQLIAARTNHVHSPALWLVTAVVFMLDLSGWFAPYSSFHLGATLAALVIASLYFATVVFETLQRITARATA
jgi:hypothetical protein